MDIYCSLFDNNHVPVSEEKGNATFKIELAADLYIFPKTFIEITFVPLPLQVS